MSIETAPEKPLAQQCKRCRYLRFKLTTLSLAILLGGCAQSNPLAITAEERSQAEESCSFKLGATDKHVLQPCLQEYAERLEAIRIQEREAERKENEDLRRVGLQVLGQVISTTVPAVAPLFAPQNGPVIPTADTIVGYSE